MKANGQDVRSDVLPVRRSLSRRGDQALQEVPVAAQRVAQRVGRRGAVLAPRRAQPVLLAPDGLGELVDRLVEDLVGLSYRASRVVDERQQRLLPPLPRWASARQVPR
ncbi:hypothetical protein MXD63_33620 [Frankia sp. Cpl3]|nr:hypothetical protein [Frankia sp. Cpl3]